MLQNILRSLLNKKRKSKLLDDDNVISPLDAMELKMSLDTDEDFENEEDGYDDDDILMLNKGGMCYADGGEVEAAGPNLKEKYDGIKKILKRKKMAQV